MSDMGAPGMSHNASNSDMAGMEHAIEQAAQVLNDEGAHCGECGREPGDPLSECPDCERFIVGYARALADAGLLAPTPLREEWGVQDIYGETPVTREAYDGAFIRSREVAETYGSGFRRAMRRVVSDWLPVDRAEGDGRADQ